MRAVTQWCSALCDPMDCSTPGSCVHKILQARILGWVAISSSKGSSPSRDRTHISCISCTGRQILYNWPTWEAGYNVNFNCSQLMPRFNPYQLQWEDLPEKNMATHSSILAWEIPWTGATIHGAARVGHNLATKPPSAPPSTGLPNRRASSSKQSPAWNFENHFWHV